MALDFSVELDSCQAEAFARAFNEESITWHKALTILSNARPYGYDSGWVIDFVDSSYFIIETGGLTTVCKSQDEFKDFFDKGLVEGRPLCRELYKQKTEMETQLHKIFNKYLGGGNDNVCH